MLETSSPEVKPAKTPLSPEKRQKMWIFIGIGIVITAVAAGAIFAATRQSTPEATPIAITTTATPAPTPPPATTASMLTGVEVGLDVATRHPLAVMIENTPGVRPQAGLGDASLVYEAITEGGITRFMAVFTDTYPAKVGPVRSARQVFVNYAEEYTPQSAYYAHVGGAANALSQISGDKMYNLDQFQVGAKAFQRFPQPGVALEHTMFAFPEKLVQAAKDFGYSTQSTFKTWQFKADADATARPDSQTITIPFSSAPYDVKYVYDKTTNSYKRFVGGAEHRDANTNKQISPRNVAIIFTTYTPNKSAGKDIQQVETNGKGKAKIFIDGKAIDATWTKPHSPERLMFTDANGQPIQFNKGQTFIEVAKTDTKVTVQ